MCRKPACSNELILACAGEALTIVICIYNYIYNYIYIVIISIITIIAIKYCQIFDNLGIINVLNDQNISKHAAGNLVVHQRIREAVMKVIVMLCGRCPKPAMALSGLADSWPRTVIKRGWKINVSKCRGFPGKIIEWMIFQPATLDLG